MPEHAHLLIEPMAAESDVSAVLAAMKQRGGGYDRNLWSPGHVWRMIDYIHSNPVRRGLCERPSDWAWSSAAEFERPGSGPITVDRRSLPDDPSD